MAVGVKLSLSLVVSMPWCDGSVVVLVSSATIVVEQAVNDEMFRPANNNKTTRI